MEEKINIAAILKDKKNGLRLYSPIFGDCTFCCVREDTNDICVKKQNGVKEFFDSKGLYYNTGEVMLFPSKSMRDWEKLSWKKGDVLVSKGRRTLHVIFEGFNDDTYTTFKGKHYLWDYADKEDYDDEEDYNDYHKEVNERTIEFENDNVNNAKTHINTIEKRFGGKLNLETLEIEKTQPELKDGDIVLVESDMIGINTSSMIAIFRKEKEIDKYKFNPALCESNEHDTYLREAPVVLSPSEIMTFRPANDSEKKKLFDALAKECKAFDSEKKQIVDLKPKVYELKPFDNVLVRDFEDQAWQVSLFSYKDSDSYYCCNGCAWNQCIPYIGNESLLGTTKDMEC